MEDATEYPRRIRQAELNAAAADRRTLEEKYGQVWNTVELTEVYNVRSFMAPYVIVERKSDGMMGTLEFQHSPRMYFNFLPNEQIR